MKLCKDCQHLANPKDNKVTWKCSHPEAAPLDYRDGTRFMSTCFDVRLFTGKCGSEGKLFVPINMPQMVTRYTVWVEFMGDAPEAAATFHDLRAAEEYQEEELAKFRCLRAWIVSKPAQVITNQE